MFSLLLKKFNAAFTFNFLTKQACRFEKIADGIMLNHSKSACKDQKL